MATGRPPVWVTIKTHFRADPRKTAVLGILTLVMVGVYARLFWSDAPDDAAAALLPVSAAAVPVMSTATVVPAATSVRESFERVRLSEPVARTISGDPFSLRLELFPSGRSPVVQNEPPPAVSEESDDVLREEARSLQLQSTLCGDVTLACINGQFLRPGQQISGFVLERVDPTRVILERQGVRIALMLK
jgi:hypothetical protein